MERTRSDARTHAEGGEASSHMHMHTGPEPGAGGVGGAAKGLLAGLASRARGAVGDRIPDTSVLDSVRGRPLTAVGIAFSAGFLLALSTRGGRRPAFVERARSRIRAVLLTGLTAAIAQELRSIVSEEDLSDLLAAWTGRDLDEFDEFDDVEPLDDSDAL